MMIELVSIITPNLNGEKYYETFIDSILNQSYNNWELIIVDDFSSEKSFNRLKDIIKVDKRIQLYRNKKNMGVSFSRNLALNHSKGNFISFCDIDDIWDYNKLKEQIAYMINKNLFFSCTEFHKVDNNGNITQNMVSDEKLNLINVLKFKFNIACSSVIYRKNNFRFNESFNHAEDYLLWINILKYTEKNKLKVDFLKGKKFLRYLKNKKSLSSNKFKQFLSVFNANKAFFDGKIFISLYYTICYVLNSIIRLIK